MGGLTLNSGAKGILLAFAPAFCWLVGW